MTASNVPIFHDGHIVLSIFGHGLGLAFQVYSGTFSLLWGQLEPPGFSPWNPTDHGQHVRAPHSHCHLLLLQSTPMCCVDPLPKSHFLFICSSQPPEWEWVLPTIPRAPLLVDSFLCDIIISLQVQCLISIETLDTSTLPKSSASSITGTRRRGQETWIMSCQLCLGRKVLPFEDNLKLLF